MTINQIKTIHQNALLAQKAGHYDEAQALYRETLSLAKDLNNPPLMAVLLNRVGRVQELTGDIQEAVISYEVGLRYLAEDPGLQLGPSLETLLHTSKNFSGSGADLNRVLNTLRGMSKGFRHSRELPDLPELYPQVLSADLDEAMANPHLDIKLLINIGNAYLRQPQDAVARAVYEQALRRPAIDQAPALKAYLLTHLGIIARREGDLPGAATYLTQAQQVFEALPDPLQQRRALVALAGLYDDRGETKKALETYQQALPLYHQAGDPRGEARARARLGRLLLVQTRLTEAEAQYQQAQPLAEQEGDQESLWHIYWGLGRCLEARGELDEAARSFDRSLTLIERRQDELATDQGKVTFVDSVIEIYDALVTIHLRRRDFAQALAVAERARGQALIDLMGVRRRRSTVRPTDTVRQGRIEKLVSGMMPDAGAHFNPVAQMAISTPVEPPAFNIASQMAQGTSLDLEIDVQDEPESPPADNTSPPAPMPSLTRLVYHILPEQTAIFAVTPENIVHGQIADIGETQLKKKVEAIRQRLQVDRKPRGVTRDATFDAGDLEPANENHESLLRELYEVLVAPVADQLPAGQTVVIEPQGPLWLLPFAALIGPDNTWLADRWPLLYAPSEATLDEIRTSPDYGDPLDLSVLIVGDPEMPPVPERYGKFKLKALVGAEEEARALAAMFQKARPNHLWLSLMLGRDATEARLLAQIPHYGIIHLATHGLAHTERPLDSFVALAQSDTEDGVLTARQVMNLSLRADLVTLSACQTGLGQISGDGMIGLSRAFLVAGARAVLVSQWSVSDEATVALMTAFYQEYLGRDDKAVALQQAMQAVRANPEFSHPRYWAPFVVVGAEA